MSRFGLIGFPIAHSLSPLLFKAAYGGRFRYDLLESEDFDTAFRAFMKSCDAVNVTAPFKELAGAIHAVARGKKALSPEIDHILRNDPPVSRLSPRQSEILHLISKGLSNLDIAKMLDISLYTVKEQVNAIFAKLGATNRAEAASIALRRHLLEA